MNRSWHPVVFGALASLFLAPSAALARGGDDVAELPIGAELVSAVHTAHGVALVILDNGAQRLFFQGASLAKADEIHSVGFARSDRLAYVTVSRGESRVHLGFDQWGPHGSIRVGSLRANPAGEKLAYVQEGPRDILFVNGEKLLTGDRLFTGSWNGTGDTLRVVAVSGRRVQVRDVAVPVEAAATGLTPTQVARNFGKAFLPDGKGWPEALPQFTRKAAKLFEMLAQIDEDEKEGPTFTEFEVLKEKIEGNEAKVTVRSKERKKSGSIVEDEVTLLLKTEGGAWKLYGVIETKGGRQKTMDFEDDEMHRQLKQLLEMMKEKGKKK